MCIGQDRTEGLESLLFLSVGFTPSLEHYTRVWSACHHHLFRFITKSGELSPSKRRNSFSGNSGILMKSEPCGGNINWVNSWDSEAYFGVGKWWKALLVHEDSSIRNRQWLTGRSLTHPGTDGRQVLCLFFSKKKKFRLSTISTGFQKYIKCVSFLHQIKQSIESHRVKMRAQSINESIKHWLTRYWPSHLHVQAEKLIDWLIDCP